MIDIKICKNCDRHYIDFCFYCYLDGKVKLIPNKKYKKSEFKYLTINMFLTLPILFFIGLKFEWKIQLTFLFGIIYGIYHSKLVEFFYSKIYGNN